MGSEGDVVKRNRGLHSVEGAGSGNGVSSKVREIQPITNFEIRES
jgi:hypothetical protein